MLRYSYVCLEPRYEEKDDGMLHREIALRLGALVCILVVLAQCQKNKLVIRALCDPISSDPAVVQMYVEVTDGYGEPVGDLTDSTFEFYEDGLPSTDEPAALFDPTAAPIEPLTVILLDWSVSTQFEIESLKAGIMALLEAATIRGDAGSFALYVFDGQANIHAVSTEFTRDLDRLAEDIDTLEYVTYQDASTNLYGAVLQSVRLLNRRLPARGLGNIVVFTDGRDTAQRISYLDFRRITQRYEGQIFTIGLGSEEQDSHILSVLGRNGGASLGSDTSITSAFHNIGERVGRYARRFYVVSYCASARGGGEHDLFIRVRGPEGVSGHLQSSFTSNNFSGMCRRETLEQLSTLPELDRCISYLWRNQKVRKSVPKRRTRNEPLPRYARKKFLD